MTGSLQRLTTLALLCGGLGVARPAGAQADKNGDDKKPATEADTTLSDEAELARVVSLVDAAKYEACVAELDRLLDSKSERPLERPQVIELARVYQATCYLGLGKPELADEPLREAIRKNPQMRAPDGLLFPPKVVERFLRVRESLFSELRAAEQAAIEKARQEAAERQRRENERWARMLMLERLARQEVVVTKNQRWIAALPFGVGQFQNGDEGLGWLFLGTEAALAATSLVTMAVHAELQTKISESERGGSVLDPSVRPRAEDVRLVLTVSTYTLIGVALVGIAEAQLNFVPEVRTVRERRLPAAKGALELSIAPEVAGDFAGGLLGVRGRF